MKRFIISFVLFLVSMASFAQEPGNNLLLNLNELQTKFADLTPSGQNGNRKLYKSPETEILFEIVSGQVVSEYTSIDGPDGFLHDLYDAFVANFEKNAIKKLSGYNGYSVTFVYSYFTIDVAYLPNKYVTLMYELLPDSFPK